MTDSNHARRRTVLKSVGVVGTALVAFSGSAAAHPHGKEQGNGNGRPQDGSTDPDGEGEGEGKGKWSRGHGSGGWKGEGYQRGKPHRDDETRWDDWEPGDGRPPWAEGDGEDEEDEDEEDEDEEDEDDDEPGPPENPGNGGDEDEDEDDEDEDDEDEDENGDEDDPEEDDPDEDDEDEEDEDDEDEDDEEEEPETVEGQIETRIHAEVNDYRDENGLDPLEFNDELAAVAREHSEDMVERDYFDHDSPEGDGPGDRLDEADVDCLGWAENIAYEFDSGFSGDEDADSVADSIVQGWIDSPGHEQNIVGDYDSEGVGIAIENNTIMATQMFCSEGN